MDPTKLLGILLLLVILLTQSQTGKSKKTIKIHVPYYVKHIHHYKKVYVPKVQVVKHEHLHKKEHDHHHHHHSHGHPSYSGGYAKSGEGGHYDDYDSSHYDDNDYYRRRVPKQTLYEGEVSKNWRGSREDSDEAAATSNESYYDDYLSDQDDEPSLPVPDYRVPKIPNRQNHEDNEHAPYVPFSYPVRRIRITT